jgi:Flp pilus assembly protein TadG
MQTVNNRKKRSRGIAIVLTTLTLSVTLPLVGLGFDVGTLFLIKSKLQTATDSAALAGARALSVGSTSSAQATNAVTVAQSFFNGNFPSGYWKTTAASASAVVDSTSTPNYRTVTVTATVQAPLYFLRVLNQQYSTINVIGQAGRRDVMMMLVLDRSNSMNQIVAGTGLSACSIMMTDAQAFLNYFAAGRDEIGLVVFGSSTYVYPPTTTFTTPDSNGNTIASLIASISCYGDTSTAAAMNAAYGQIQTVNSTTRENVVVLMTDGLPTSITADFVADHLIRNNDFGCNPTGPSVFGGGTVNGNMFPGGSLGLLVPSQPLLSNPDTVILPTGSGCHFWLPLGSYANMGYVSQDVASLPTADYFGNSTQGNYTIESPSYGSAANLNDVTDAQGAVYAAINAVDNQANTIRTNATLKPYIYTIGLSGDGAVDQYPDPLLLMKMANDPNLAGISGAGQTFYNQQIGQPQGLNVNAPDATQLALAFDTIARQISIRLSQ